MVGVVASGGSGRGRPGTLGRSACRYAASAPHHDERRPGRSQDQGEQRDPPAAHRPARAGVRCGRGRHRSRRRGRGGRCGTGGGGGARRSGRRRRRRGSSIQVAARFHQPPDRVEARSRHREAPVEQRGGLHPLPSRLLGARQHRHHQPVTTALRDPDIGVARVVGEPGLAADGARVVGQQLVVVGDAEGRVDVEAGKHRVRRAEQLGEAGDRQSLAHDQRQVVGRGLLAGAVEPRHRHRAGVQRAESGGQRVHLGDGGLDATVRPGERVGGVVAGVEQQPEEEVADGVDTAVPDADPGALHVGVLLGTDDGRVEVGEVAHQDDRGQQLQRGRGPVAAVHVLAAQHPAGGEVGDHPGGGGDVGRQWGSTGGQHEAAAPHRGPADGFGRDR